MDPIAALWEACMNALKPYSSIPNSTIFILALALLLSFITNLANRLLVDVQKLRRLSKEVAAWREEFDRARKSGDKQLMAKVAKKQQSMMKLQSKMMWDRMKISFIFIIPFWIIWIILSSFFGNSTVAKSPFTIPWILGSELSFAAWYILCSFAISLPLSRLFGLNPED